VNLFTCDDVDFNELDNLLPSEKNSIETTYLILFKIPLKITSTFKIVVLI